MKVYVVVAYDDQYAYGGYEKPEAIGAFSTPEAAESCAAAYRHKDRQGYQQHALVAPLVLDDPEEARQ